MIATHVCSRPSLHAWRTRRALLLRSRGWLYREIAASLGVSTERARQIVRNGAYGFMAPALRCLSQEDALARALWVLRMRAFNLTIARRALKR